MLGRLVVAKSPAWQSPTELAYLAGFFDGEGYVGISSDHPKWKNGDVYYRLRINVAQKNPVVLLRLKSIYGGTLHQGKDGVWKWYADGKMGCSFLSDIFPFLVIKKQQVELALEFQSLNVGKGKTSLQKERQEQIAKSVKQMKRDQYA